MAAKMLQCVIFVEFIAFQLRYKNKNVTEILFNFFVFIWQLQRLKKSANRPYALTSRLHNNDAMLGGQDLSRYAHVLCWQSALALSLSVSARAQASPAVWHAGVGSLAAGLTIAHMAVPRLTPNTRGCPSVTSYA